MTRDRRQTAGEVSWIIRISYTSTATLIFSRVLTGLAAGGCFSVVPMYIKEISQDDIRGTLGTISTINQTLGVLFVYAIGAYLDYYTVGYIIAVLPILAIFSMLKAPESPAFLVKQGKVDEATKTVAYLRGLSEEDKIVEGIIHSMRNEDIYFKSLPNLTILSILKRKPWRKAFLLSMMIFTFFEMNGAYAIVTYASAILNSTGIDFNIRPEIQALSLPVIMIIGSLTLAASVDRVGRKPLLILTFSISVCATLGMAAIILLQMQGVSVPVWMPVVAMMASMVTYSGGILPLCYIIMTEMFSFQIRAKLMGVVVTYAWLLTFALVSIYAPMSNNLGPFSPFILWGLVNLAGAIFTVIFLPETKGKSEEEIYKFLIKGEKSEEEGEATESPVGHSK